MCGDPCWICWYIYLWTVIHFSSSVRNKRKQNFHFCIQTNTHACMHQSFTFIVIQIAYIVCTKICSENRLHVVRLEMFTFWCTSFRSVLFYSISLIRAQYLICDCDSTLQRQVVDSRKCNTQSKQTEGKMKIVPMMIKWEWSVYRDDDSQQECWVTEYVCMNVWECEYASACNVV